MGPRLNDDDDMSMTKFYKCVEKCMCKKLYNSDGHVIIEK